MEIKVGNYTSSTIHEAYQQAQNVIFPLGAIEAHGAHLPLATDNLIAEAYCTALAAETNSLMLPLLPYGQVWSLEKAPGSIHIKEETLVLFIEDIIKSLDKDRVKMVTIVTTHFGNKNAIMQVARRVYEKLNIKVICLTYPNLKENKEIFDQRCSQDNFFHADEIETSLLLSFANQLVDISKYKKGLLTLDERLMYTPIRWTEFTQDYIVGDPAQASAEKGEQFLKLTIQSAKKIIEEELREVEMKK